MRIPQQVSDRVKEAPAQVLRAVFAGVGQVLLVADRVRSRAADSERAGTSATAQPARPAQPRREAPPARPAPAPRVVNRWRSLDETGNVRLLSRDDEMEDEPPAAAAAQVPVAEPEPAAETEPAAEWQPAAETEPATEWEPAADPVADTVDEIPAIAEPIAEPVAVTDVPAGEAAPAAETQAVPEPAGAADAPVAEPAAAAQDVAAAPAEQSPEAGLAVLPVANYDGLTIASLRARLRNLDPAQLRVLIDYEKAHAGRGDVLTMFERRITKLESGA